MTYEVIIIDNTTPELGTFHYYAENKASKWEKVTEDSYLDMDESLFTGNGFIVLSRPDGTVLIEECTLEMIDVHLIKEMAKIAEWHRVTAE